MNDLLMLRLRRPEIRWGKGELFSKANSKYELVKDDIKNVSFLMNPKTNYYSSPIVLHRIRALKDFGDVKKGDLGGYITSDTIIDESGDCWVYDDSIVINSVVRGDCKIRESSILIHSITNGSMNISSSIIYYCDITASDNMNIVRRIFSCVIGTLVLESDICELYQFPNACWIANSVNNIVYLDTRNTIRYISQCPFDAEHLLREEPVNGQFHYVLAGGYGKQRPLNITRKPSASPNFMSEMLSERNAKTEYMLPPLSPDVVQKILSSKIQLHHLIPRTQNNSLGQSGDIIQRDKITGPYGDKSLADLFKYVNTNYDDIDKNSLYVTHHRGVPVFEPEIDNDMMNENETDNLLKLHKIKITDNAATPLRLTYRNEYNRDVICHVMKIQKTNDDGAPLYHKVFTSEGACPCCGDQSGRCICDPDDENDYEEYALAELWLSLYEDNILFEY